MKRKPSQMERAKAARALLDAHQSRDVREGEVAAFMAIFHPDRQLPKGQRYTAEKGAE